MVHCFSTHTSALRCAQVRDIIIPYLFMKNRAKATRARRIPYPIYVPAVDALHCSLHRLTHPALHANVPRKRFRAIDFYARFNQFAGKEKAVLAAKEIADSQAAPLNNDHARKLLAAVKRHPADVASARPLSQLQACKGKLRQVSHRAATRCCYANLSNGVDRFRGTGNPGISVPVVQLLKFVIHVSR